jgi:hypothetical protein
MTDATMTRAVAETIGADAVIGELRRKIEIERSWIAADIQGGLPGGLWDVDWIGRSGRRY